MQPRNKIIIICMMFLASFFILIPTTSAATTIYVDDSGGYDFTTIQEAINNANASDTIYVYGGTYDENVVIDKQITLTGETSTTTIINAASTGHVIDITANSVIISGFTIQNAIGSGYDGIRLTSVQSCQITSNIIKDNDEGISLVSSNQNTLSGNTIEDNEQNGIGLINSIDNTINGNIIHRNTGGQGIKGISLQQTSTGNTISDNTITGTSQEGFTYGIHIQTGANSNTITDNSIMNNNYGIHIASSSNSIYHNTLDNKQTNAKDTGSNTWYSGSLSEGNRWYDYTGEDSNNDGIGDTPYAIEGGSNQDIYPLVDQKPTAVINTISPNQATYGTTISFQGQGFDNGNIEGYEWSSTLESGTLSTSSSFSTSTLKIGSHTIRFRVKDNEDQWSDYAEQTLTISEEQTGGDGDGDPENQKPIAEILSITPNPATYGQTISFSGQGTDNDEGDTITEYLWREGETTLSTSVSFETSNLVVGTPTIYFKVKDNNNAWSNEVSQTLTITQGSSSGDQNPISNPGGPYAGIEDESIRFDGSMSYDNEGNIAEYTWDFDDGTTESGEFVDHIYESGGEYTITLTVTDNSGNTHTETTTATIESTTRDNGSESTPGFGLISIIISMIVIIIIRRKQ